MDSSALPEMDFDAAERPSSDLKRKRSDSNDAPTAHPTKKSASSAHVQINYLARQNHEDLPLVAQDDALPSLNGILANYQGILERHESMAVNLGAQLLGPVIIQRFETSFGGPPRVLKCHGKEGTTVTWLDVIEFARNKPEQFQLGQMSEGARVCQFYTKQCRVQISELDYQLIISGLPQQMIPPQPIAEDEEKELGTIEILEKTLGHLTHLADQVAARTRQINNRLKGRKQAILDRRASEQPIAGSAALRASSPSNVALMNGVGGTAQMSQPGGFVPVNAQISQHNGSHSAPESPSMSRLSSGGRGSIGASPDTHRDLLSRFTTVAQRNQQSTNDAFGATPGATSHAGLNGSNTHKSSDYGAFPTPSADSRPMARPSQTHLSHSSHNTPSRPSSNNQVSRDGHSQPNDRQSSQRASAASEEGPYKGAMVARMESLGKGDRIVPPCDRCRRLHMDCLKNLTACMGCTKKHAKCSWREVKAEELQGWDPNNGLLSSYQPASGTTDPALSRNHSISSDRADAFATYRSASSGGNGNGGGGTNPGSRPLSAAEEETYAALQRESQRQRDEEGLSQARALSLAQLSAQAQLVSQTTTNNPLPTLNSAGAPPVPNPPQQDPYFHTHQQQRESLYSPPNASVPTSASASASTAPTSALSDAGFRPLAQQEGIADLGSVTAGSTAESMAQLQHGDADVGINGSSRGDSADDEAEKTAMAAAAMARVAGALRDSAGVT
ncbi:MAG: hypothetical protein M1820_005063 [Bogoriella megaspora]|nr:MAG: hypothetical protein M1820_005063 [Bogoriella megaspora]